MREESRVYFIRILLPMLLVVLTGCGNLAAPGEETAHMQYQLILTNPGMALELNEIIGALESWSPPDEQWGSARRLALNLLPGHRGLRFTWMDTAGWAPPGQQHLNRYGLGFNEAERQRCITARRGLRLSLSCARTDVRTLYPALQALVLALAEADRDYIFDELSGMVMTTAFFRKSLFSPATANMKLHIGVVHFPYEPGRFLLTSLGMGKFACPELELRDFSPARLLVAQRLLEAVTRQLILLRLQESGPAMLPSVISIHPHEILAGLSPDLETTGISTSANQPESLINVRIVANGEPTDDGQGAASRLIVESSGADPWDKTLAEKTFGLDLAGLITTEAMKDRIQSARETFPWSLDEPSGDTSGHTPLFIRFPAPLPDDSFQEYLLGLVESRTSEHFQVLLLSQPILFRGVSAGVRIAIPADDLSDWITVSPSGELSGNYLSDPSR